MPYALSVAVAQPESISGDLAGNVTRHADAILSARARAIVFPEMSLTGYELHADAVLLDDPILLPLVEACRLRGSLALVGAPIQERTNDDGIVEYIATLLVDGDGVSGVYRKMYLGDEEAKRFTPGPGPVVIDVDGWRLGLAICKDTGVVEHAAATAALGMDIYVAGVLESAEDAEVPAERARRVALKHGAWVVMSSFAGPTGGGFDHSAGCSGIWRPDGSVVARTGPEVGEMARSVIS